MTKHEEEIIELFKDVSDSQIVQMIILRYSSRRPIKKYVSEKEYEKEMKEAISKLVRSDRPLNKLEEALAELYCDVYQEPIYKYNGSGLLAQLEHPPEVIGYKYYRVVGYEMVLTLGSDQMFLLESRGLIKDGKLVYCIEEYERPDSCTDSVPRVSSAG